MCGFDPNALVARIRGHARRLPQRYHLMTMMLAAPLLASIYLRRHDRGLQRQSQAAFAQTSRALADLDTRAPTRAQKKYELMPS
jgi:DNA-binding response OmpR family regulator